VQTTPTHTHTTQTKLQNTSTTSLKTEWEVRRINKESQMFFKNLLESINYDQPKITKALLAHSTKEISTIIKVLSGHNCLYHHLYNAQLNYTAICN
jgi:hypothetical protein